MLSPQARRNGIFSSAPDTTFSRTRRDERTAKVGVRLQILDFGFKILESTCNIFIAPHLIHLPHRDASARELRE